VRFGWSRVVSECRLEHYVLQPAFGYHPTPVHQYTPKHSSTPTYSRQLLRMNVITFETCWAIKNFQKLTSSWFNLFKWWFVHPLYKVKSTVINHMIGHQHMSLWNSDSEDYVITFYGGDKAINPKRQKLNTISSNDVIFNFQPQRKQDRIWVQDLKNPKFQSKSQTAKWSRRTMQIFSCLPLQHAKELIWITPCPNHFIHLQARSKGAVQARK